jgi:hypothetical protein
LSMSKDEFYVKIVGNLIADPKLAQDEEGNKVCYCKIATNPRAKKVDPRTGKTLSEKERTRLRTFAELKIPKTAAAEKFFASMSNQDRVWVEGEGGTKRVPKMVKSEEDGKWYEYQIDVDGDGKNLQTLSEDRLVIRVYKFGKIVNHDGYNVVAYV